MQHTHYGIVNGDKPIKCHSCGEEFVGGVPAEATAKASTEWQQSDEITITIATLRQAQQEADAAGYQRGYNQAKLDILLQMRDADLIWISEKTCHDCGGNKTHTIVHMADIHGEDVIPGIWEEEDAIEINNTPRKKI